MFGVNFYNLSADLMYTEAVYWSRIGTRTMFHCVVHMLLISTLSSGAVVVMMGW
jgi:hypothetical protein